jgi:colanic acid biosynthesis glycosyl transferase WcaI
MRISIHTMYFLPDFGSAPILMDELARHLASKGHEVEVVTTLPRRRSAEFAGLFYSRRRSDGFVVKRFWTNTTPPLQLGVPAFLAKSLRRTPVLLSVQDIHPDLAIESGILRNPAGIRFARALERWVYGMSDRLAVISEGFRANLAGKGVPDAKMKVIPNWVDTDVLMPLPKDNPISRAYGFADKFVILYSGTISISSNLALEGVLQAARRLAREKDILFAIAGEGLKKASLQAKAEALGLTNVVFPPFQPYADLPRFLASADVLLVPLDREKSQLSVPSKLYNFMAAGRPILGLATPDSEVAAILREQSCGLSVPPGRPDEAAEAVLALRRSPDLRAAFAAKARRYVTDHFAKDRILEAYEDLMISMASHRRGVRP